MINLKTIENKLTDEQVIKLVTNLGSDTYIDNPSYIQFKTICHNEDPSEASLKLYYYKKNKKFHCYTDCGDNFNIFELFKRRYELLGKEYNFYKDIVLVLIALVFTLIVVIAHRDNIKRLLNGTENKISLGKKSKKTE